MSITAKHIRMILEGYGITTAVLSDGWIENCINEEIIPHVEEITGMSFDGEQTVTEYYSGNGSTVLILNRRPVNALVSLTYIDSFAEGSLVDSVELIAAEGVIKAKTDYNEGVMAPIFKRGNKNIKVQYTVGAADYPAKVARAIKNFTAARALNTIGSRTGGGSVSVQSHGRNYGEAGKYTDIRKELVRMGYFLLREYMTGVVGS